MSEMDFRALEKYTEELKKLNDDKIIEEFIRHVLRNMALRTLTRAIKLTPTITGYLRRGWLLQEKTGEPSAKEIKEFINNVQITKSGNEYSITLANNVKYAVYVNYGHRQEVGRYVPAIGKKLVKSWVDGKFFLEKAEEWIKNNKTRIVREEYTKFLKRYFER